MAGRKLMMLALGLSGFFLAGCAVTCYDSAPRPGDVMKITAESKYNIVSAETVYLKAFDANGRLPEIELNFLTGATKNQPGDMYGDIWKKTLPGLEDAYGYLKIRSEDTADLRLSSRSSNPVLFDESAGCVPIRIKTVAVFSPEVFSAGWTTSYVLTLSMSPMKKYNYGALLVTVTDADGKTIGTRTIGIYRTLWFSALMPTALFACGDQSSGGAFFRDMSSDEKAMQTVLVVQAVAEIVSEKQGIVIDQRWCNIRSAVVEALAIGNSDAAVRLLKSARDAKIGGEEPKAFLSLLGE